MRPPQSLQIDPDLEGLARFMRDAIPFNRFLGMQVDHLVRGACVLRIPWTDNLIGDPRRPAVHGGVLSTLIDTAGGAAVFSELLGGKDRVSTVDLRVDYLRPAPSEDLVCFAHLVRMGNKVAVTRMFVFAGGVPGPEDDDPQATALATGSAVYNVVRPTDNARP